jgi:hypothetical protein
VSARWMECAWGAVEVVEWAADTVVSWVGVVRGRWD